MPGIHISSTEGAAITSNTILEPSPRRHRPPSELCGCTDERLGFFFLRMENTVKLHISPTEATKLSLAIVRTAQDMDLTELEVSTAILRSIAVGGEGNLLKLIPRLTEKEVEIIAAIHHRECPAYEASFLLPLADTVPRKPLA